MTSLGQTMLQIKRLPDRLIFKNEVQNFLFHLQFYHLQMVMRTAFLKSF